MTTTTFELTNGLGDRGPLRSRKAHNLTAHAAMSEEERAADDEKRDRERVRDHHFPPFRLTVTHENLDQARSTVPKELADKIVPGCEMWRGGHWPMVLWLDDSGAAATSDGVMMGTWKYPSEDGGWDLRAELITQEWIFDPRGSCIAA